MNSTVHGPARLEIIGDLGRRFDRLELSRAPLSEFEKLEGCVTCLSVRLRGVPDR